ncbi:MAG: TonB-dependent receptor [Dysgonamonadaceae bacterium]|jgi:hypothetical protein|nr:TonB-dependent receptor [Dysgonamonadaceae bacterium]
MLIALLLFFPLLLFSQTRTVGGTVCDASTGAPLVGASVSIAESKTGVTTDAKGSFSISLPSENCILAITYVGYESQKIRINRDTPPVVNIKLHTNLLLKEVVVSSLRKDRNVTALTMGTERMSMEEIRLLPAIMGETDILKTLQLLPGVQSVSESSNGFSVRGGSPDQNLILLDNSTVYNPSHQMGFFSAFNSDFMQGIELYKGHFPARQGGRLSSLLEVSTKNDIPAKITGTGGIGLISSRLMIEGPLGSRTSWYAAARRTYADLFLFLAPNEDLHDVSLYFYDLNGKMTHRFSERDNLEFNIYNGLDRMGVNIGHFNYGNTASSLRWNHSFSETLFGKFSLHYTNYLYDLGSDMEGMTVTWISGIRDLGARADFHHLLNPAFDLSYGLTGTYHFFNPGKVYLSGMDLDDYIIPGNEALELAAYLSNEQQVSDRFSLKYGLRYSMFSNYGKNAHTYSAWEPGLGAVFRLTETSSAKANYSHNTQYMQLANNSSAGSPLDVWFSASKNIKPQQVDIVSAGYFRNFSDNRYETSVEVYYKNLKDVIDFREHSQLLLNQDLESEVRTGRGKAYGIEFMVRKNSGRLTGFANYTLSRSERTIPEINQGKTYLAPYDKTHAVNIAATYILSKKLTASAVWVFATGTPSTYPSGRFAIGGDYFPIYSARNEFRKPDYHRMDISLNYAPKAGSAKRWKGEWFISLYNVYNQKNPWIIYYDQDDVTGIPYAEKMYLFGIVPSFGYNFKF